ncbi:HupE/UreJ family protein [Thiomonas intermedia]|uniref:HupE/UreJ family protein n=1 Tax=Thiomonas intermedia TaxID=926 RepID=UPI0009A4FA17|nr:HupE/UreJ family protein [Thiomonas intermedia]
MQASTHLSSRSRIRALLGLALFAVATSALAHTGNDGGLHHSFGSGFVHPFTGLDHLSAMVAVGLWSAISAAAVDRRLLWAPTGFASMLLLGALLGFAGVQLPAVEPMIAASVLVIGLFAAVRLRLAGWVAAGVVGAFAVFHGLAHGEELAGVAGRWAVVAGMVSATVLLHAAGLGAGLALRRTGRWGALLAGGTIAGMGASLLGGWVAA